jgi:hypothetical protein
VKLGIAGRLTAAFINSPLTPLLLLASLALGLVALVTLPREEEPQISVPMVDIHVRADGLAPKRGQTGHRPQTLVQSIDGVEHVYSQTRDQVLVTAPLVGTSSDSAILRVHDKVRANMDRIQVGIPEPLIVGRGIDDVAIVVVSLAPEPAAADRWDANGLTRLARELRRSRWRSCPTSASPTSSGTSPRRSASSPIRSGCRSTGSRSSSFRRRSRAPTAPSSPARFVTADARSTSWPGRRCRVRRRSATSS